MSWSRSISGTPSSVRKQLEHAVKEVEAADRASGASDAIVNVHRAQVESAVGSVIGLTDKLPETVSISGSIYGSASAPTVGPVTGSLGVSINVGGTFQAPE